ncbi:hypothetical protein HPB51_028455 [Rhipicephalus microplus]|uniref:Uncharacterized protein n=1 Tax=Rhipicephalus microplus TaxID=6941 RepID=A0A9J6CXR3_RHIMP|nr:hypothetical protein HPB51_028455 [Rhipicephalus microplus]
MHLKKPNSADTEEKCHRHEKEKKKVRNEEETDSGERRKRKRQDKEADETAAVNMTAPGDVLKVDVNRNKKRKSEEGDDEVARKGALWQILKPEKAASSCCQEDMRSGKKKTQCQGINPKEFVRTGIVGDEFDSLLWSGASAAFLKTVDEVRLSLRNNTPLLNLEPLSIIHIASTKSVLGIAEFIPETDFSILCRDFDEDWLPPPSARTVYALMALAMSTMDSESLYRGNENIERSALAYVLLKINKLGLRSGIAIMNELSKYYALLFGKRPHEFIIGCQSIHHQEQQEEGQPPIFDGMFDYFSGSPVTVCHLKKKEFYYSWRKPILSLRVAHRIQDEKSKHYYVYKVKGQQDSAYAVLRMLLNPLFLSDRWTGVLFDEVPRNLQGKIKDMYRNAIIHASTGMYNGQVAFRYLQAVSEGHV